MATKKRMPARGPVEESSSLDALFANSAGGLSEEDTGDLASAAEDALASRSGPVVPVVVQGRLEYVAPDGTSHTKVLGEDTSIGRHTDNDIQLLDPEVSKAHLVIKKKGGAWVLQDLGSANGTLVNGVRL